MIPVLEAKKIQLPALCSRKENAEVPFGAFSVPLRKYTESHLVAKKHSCRRYAAAREMQKSLSGAFAVPLRKCTESH